MNTRIVSVRIRHEHDIVAARRRARDIAAILGLDPTAQTRVATAVSELARNAFQYAGGGVIHYNVEGTAPPQLLTVHVIDTGPGIERLDQVLAGAFRSSTGMGLGLPIVNELIHAHGGRVEVDSQPGKGSTFRVIVPMLRRPVRSPAPDAPAPSRSGILT